MLQARDDIFERLAAVSTTDKWAAVQLILLFNSAVGLGFFLGALFVDARLGGGASFQVVVTAVVHEAYSLYLLQVTRERDLRHADFLGGIMVMMNLLLLQTAALWGDFAGGLALGPVGMCQFQGGSAERFVATLAALIFVSHMLLTGLILLWKGELVAATSYKEHVGGQTGPGAGAAHLHDPEDLPLRGSAGLGPPGLGAVASPGNGLAGHGGYQNAAAGGAAHAAAPSAGRFVIDDDDAEL